MTSSDREKRIDKLGWIFREWFQRQPENPVQKQFIGGEYPVKVQKTLNKVN
jgi:hypothetical protein